MSWLERLYETYEHCAGREPDGGAKLIPLYHEVREAQVEVVLDRKGTFKRALVVPKHDAKTLIPATEASAGRTSGIAPHPLCDELQYVAGDFATFAGGEITNAPDDKLKPLHSTFVRNLTAWGSKSKHPKLDAILAYVQLGRLTRDLVEERVLHLDPQGRLLNKDKWAGPKESMPLILGLVGNRSLHKVLVRWRVETFGDPHSATWTDESLIAAWIEYYRSQLLTVGFCMVTGASVPLASQHAKGLRHAGDRAKLISSNDDKGFTFRGRFIDANEAVSVGVEVSQKAHNALKWLLERQAHRDGGDQVYLAWSPRGASVPDPAVSTNSLFGNDDEHEPADTAEAFAKRLNRKIAGYKAELGERDDVIILGLDSASDGRMAITYYRTLPGSEFLDRVEKWHSRFAWRLEVDKEPPFIGAPAPKGIAKAAFGSTVSDTQKKATVERLVPCIIDSTPLPRDLVESAVRRACSKAGSSRSERPEWAKTLAIACALFRGYHVERNYSMTLELDRTTRDYLYGRLLAVADNIERYALDRVEENRSTNAERLMQRFAARPFDTWPTIYLSLRPYLDRLRSTAPRFVFHRENLLRDIMCLFRTGDFENPSPLSGEFLLGFHTQSKSLKAKSVPQGDAEDPDILDPTSDDEMSDDE